jgi:hypothetical protein
MTMKVGFWDQVIFYVVVGPILLLFAYLQFKFIEWLKNLGRHTPTIKAAEISGRSEGANPMRSPLPRVPLRSTLSIIFWYDIGSRILVWMLCLFLPFLASSLPSLVTPPQKAEKPDFRRNLKVIKAESDEKMLTWIAILWTVAATWRAAFIHSVVSKGVVIPGRVISARELKAGDMPDGAGRIDIEYEFAGRSYRRAMSAILPIDGAANDLLLYVHPRKPRRCLVAAIYRLEG